jgi:hypothetical protein
VNSELWMSLKCDSDSRSLVSGSVGFASFLCASPKGGGATAASALSLEVRGTMAGS